MLNFSKLVLATLALGTSMFAAGCACQQGKGPTTQAAGACEKCEMKPVKASASGMDECTTCQGDPKACPTGGDKCPMK